MSAVLMSVVIGVIGLVLFYITQKIITFLKWHRRMKKILSHFPGPKPHWFFGNALQIGTFHDFVTRMHKKYVENLHTKGYSFWVFTVQPVVFLTHPDTIKVIMKSNAPKAKGNIGYSFMIPWIGDSLLVTHGSKWERNRRLLTPAFHFSVLNGYFEIYNDVADTLLEKLSNGSKSGQYIEVYQNSALAVLDSLMQCSLSYKGNIQSVGESHPYVKAVKRLVELVMARNLNLLFYPEWLYRLSPSGKEFFNLCDYVHQFAEDIIEKRKQELMNNVSIIKKRQMDFLDILLTAKDDNGQGLTDEEIRSEVDTFMFAGHETTASVLSWSIYALGKYKHIQDKVYREVKKVIGDKQHIDGDDISEMKYLSCFLKEVMRQYTPVPLIARTLEKPTVVNGVELPEGILTILGIHSGHHHPDVWDDPWEFKPERFEVSIQRDMDPYSFTPFSAGPRNCIGQSFAQSEEKVLIARIINRFEISLDPDHKVEPFIEFVMRAKNGIMVSFKDRS
ncbi:ultra-long-chain fatty acid omega-hydroxylase-like [Mytilus edulis]|uniref:ultra-long-chain fatty acid omega-hydroxylase-like n=1 Tax=Mytilus edulis TaxID=6550 RepID=UPI0039EE88D3